jgi:hypothetical protein
MKEKAMSISEEILYMQRQMGEDADLDTARDIDDYEDYLYELSSSELYDTHSFVYERYREWRKVQKNANSA